MTVDTPTCSQMLRRIRNVGEKILYILIDNQIPPTAYQSKEQIKNKSLAEEFIFANMFPEDLSFDIKEDGSYPNNHVDDVLWQGYIDHLYKRNSSRKYFIEVFIEQEKRSGVEVILKEQISTNKTESKCINKIVKNIENEEIQNMANATLDAVKKEIPSIKNINDYKTYVVKKKKSGDPMEQSVKFLHARDEFRSIYSQRDDWVTLATLKKYNHIKIKNWFQRIRLYYTKIDEQAISNLSIKQLKNNILLENRFRVYASRAILKGVKLNFREGKNKISQADLKKNLDKIFSCMNKERLKTIKGLCYKSPNEDNNVSNFHLQLILTNELLDQTLGCKIDHITSKNEYYYLKHEAMKDYFVWRGNDDMGEDNDKPSII